MSCKSTSGLTRHKSTCRKNPRNLYVPPTPILRTPSPFRDDGFFGLAGVRTPENHGGIPDNFTTPVNHSPRRYQWTTNGRGMKTRVHPYLDGRFFIFISRKLQPTNGDVFNRTAL